PRAPDRDRDRVPRFRAPSLRLPPARRSREPPRGGAARARELRAPVVSRGLGPAAGGLADVPGGPAHAPGAAWAALLAPEAAGAQRGGVRGAEHHGCPVEVRGARHPARAGGRGGAAHARPLGHARALGRAKLRVPDRRRRPALARPPAGDAGRGLRGPGPARARRPPARPRGAPRARRRLTPVGPGGRARARPCAPRRGLPGRVGGRLVALPEAELVAVRIAAGGEPAHLGDRGGLARLAAELPDASHAGVDLVDREVGARAAPSRLHVRDRRALVLGDPGHVVLGRAGKRLELPAEQRGPELPAAGGVVGGDLQVNDLPWHGLLLSSGSGSSL